MTIIDRYIGGQLIQAILLTSFALLAVDLFFYISNEIRYVGDGNYTLVKALQFILLTVPRRIYTMFPWAALVGSLLGLGGLAKNSELTAMRSSSMSINRIAWSVMKATLLLAVFMLLLGEFIAPIAERLAKQTKALAITNGQTIYTMSGAWVRNEKDFLHIGLVASANELHNVTRFKFTENMKLEEILFAKEAKNIKHTWYLEDVIGTKIYTDKITDIGWKELEVEGLLDPEIIENSTVEHLERLSIKSLFDVIQSRSNNELNTKEYELAFWKKVVNPFAILAMVYLSIPFVFGPLRSSSVGLKLLAGVIVGFVFYTLNAILTPLITIINFPTWLAGILPTVIFSIIGIYNIKKIK